MIVNCGLFKTGSTGTYNIVRVALQKKLNIEGFGFAVNILSMKPDEVESQIVVKTHHLNMNHSDFINTSGCKFICTIRDPRGSASSFYEKYDKINDFTFDLINDCWDNTYPTLLSCNQANVLFIEYSDLVNRFNHVIKQILDFIDIDYDEEFINLISAETHPLKYKNDVVANLDGDASDEKTLLHSKHISGNLDLSGNKWKELPQKLQLSICEKFKPILLKYNYETEETLTKLISELSI